MTVSTSAENRPETQAAAIDLPCPSGAGGDAGLPPQRRECCDLRSTLGSFATGITVITARTDDGEPIGLTISSFNSVSLDPPLILWSLSVNSPRLEAFRSASHYAVNVLAADQQWLSDRFAGRRNDRFADLPQLAGLGGVPLLEGCSAWFECANEAQYPGGDHVIFVGRVERFAQGEAQSPLIFHGGRYRQLAP